MSSSKHPEPALEILERLRQPVPMREPSEAKTQRKIATDAIAHAIRQSRRNRTRRIAWLSLGVAAAAIIGSMGVAFTLAPAPAGGIRASTSSAPAPSTILGVVAGSV